MLFAAVALMFLAPGWTTLTFEKAGWLDRMVAYHRKLFFKDVDQMPPEPIIATVTSMAPGYVDSPAWNFDSVMRLITLVHASDAAKTARRAIRRALGPTRRFISRGRNTFKLFPSLAKHSLNNIYYDMDSAEYYAEDFLSEVNVTDEDAVVVVSNPVEARLPSAQISIKLLKEIMEARAEAARVMPSTTKATVLWHTVSKTAAADDAASTAADTTTDGAATTAGDGGAETTVAQAEEEPAR